MAMKEAYVSYKTAQLLKEKGFIIPSDTSYEDYLWQMYDENGKVHWGVYNSDWYFRITQQMACRWLREEKGIHIAVLPCEKGFHAMIYHTVIAPHLEYLGSVQDKEHDNPTPQQVLEAALQYVLTNLI